METNKDIKDVRNIFLSRLQNYFSHMPKSYFVTNKYKIFHFCDRFNQLKDKGFLFPIMARVDITLACNHNCFFCMYRSSKSLAKASTENLSQLLKNRKVNVEKDKILSILRRMYKYGLKSVMFTGGGEPLLHPDFKSILLETLKIGLKVGIITNGSLLTDDLFKLFNQNGFEWIRVSLDSATEKTWYKIHRPHFGLSFKEIISILAKYAKDKKRKYHIGINFVITKYNLKEIIPAIDLAANLGIDSIRITPAYLKDTSFLNELKISKILEKIKEKEKEHKNLNITFNYERVNTRLKKEKIPICFISFVSISIGADLKIYPCCMYKYDKKNILLDLNKEKIDSSFAKKLISKCLKYPINNDICGHCMFKNFNLMCSYLVLDEPMCCSFVV